MGFTFLQDLFNPQAEKDTPDVVEFVDDIPLDPDDTPDEDASNPERKE